MFGPSDEEWRIYGWMLVILAAVALAVSFGLGALFVWVAA